MAKQTPNLPDAEFPAILDAVLGAHAWRNEFVSPEGIAFGATLPTAASATAPTFALLTAEDGANPPGLYYRLTVDGAWVNVAGASAAPVSPGTKYAAIKATADIGGGEFTAGSHEASSETITPPVASENRYLGFASEYPLAQIYRDGVEFLHLFNVGDATLGGHRYSTYISKGALSPALINTAWTLEEADR